MNNVFAIGIPTINRADLLNDSLAKYVHDFPNTHIFIVDNGRQNLFSHPNIHITTQEHNLGVAGSWNFLCRQIYSIVKSAVIMNDDIYWGRSEGEVLQFIGENEAEDFLVSYGNWCNFILPQKTHAAIGDFDEEFINGYYEDNDYHYRMKLADKTYFPSLFMTPVVYRNSMSIEKDPGLNNRFGDNKQRYLNKWGGMPGNEVYKHPFNQMPA